MDFSSLEPWTPEKDSRRERPQAEIDALNQEVSHAIAVAATDLLLGEDDRSVDTDWDRPWLRYMRRRLRELHDRAMATCGDEDGIVPFLERIPDALREGWEDALRARGTEW